MPWIQRNPDSPNQAGEDLEDLYVATPPGSPQSPASQCQLVRERLQSEASIAERTASHASCIITDKEHVELPRDCYATHGLSDADDCESQELDGVSVRVPMYRSAEEALPLPHSVLHDPAGLADCGVPEGIAYSDDAWGDEQIHAQGDQLLQDDENDLDCGEVSRERLLHLCRENVVLLGDHSCLRAKFDLMHQTLRSIFRLGPEATWADVLEHGEALAETSGSLYTNGLANGSGGCTSADADIERRAFAKEAELECEQLEEKLEAQTALIARLRSLLQKQQRLLDETAQQIENQHAQTEKQKETIKVLEERVAELEEHGSRQDKETITVLEERVAELEEHCSRQESEVSTHIETLHRERKVQAAHEERHRTNDARMAELEATISRNDVEIRGLRSEGVKEKAKVAQHKGDAEKHQVQYEAMHDELEQHRERIEQYRAQLQNYEQAERRQFSYPKPKDSLLKQHDGPGRSAGGPCPAMQRIPSTIDSTERDAFLSHFPMASRTEQRMRNRLESEGALSSRRSRQAGT